jgi:hypothetical protein
MLVGHTLDDFDTQFNYWNMKLKEHDYPIIPLLMKSFMDVESLLVILLGSRVVVKGWRNLAF